MVGEQDGINYIAQEYVQGRTLKDYVKRKGPMEIKLALHILRQVASALLAASENGIVHRDIKPENILLTNKGEAKVADFGLAQLTLQGERVSLTQTGVTMGTPLYMSPEQINGQPLDSRSDIYSFGVMAWHMFSGRPPFIGETAMAVAVKHLNEKPPLLTDVREDIPASIRDFVKRMIQKKKEDRHPDFAAVLSDIKQIVRQVTGKEDATVPLTPPPPRKTFFFDRPFRRQIGWLIAACVLVTSITASIGWTMRTPDLTTVASNGAPNVRPMPNADAQLYWAASHPQDEGAWVAVKAYSGATDEMKARSLAALGLIYLKSNRRQLAETTFNDLATEPKYKANGYAGLALLAALKGDMPQAKQHIGQTDAIDVKLFPEMDVAYKELHQRLIPAN
jgi:serine/threonine-protein kinase